MEGKLSWLRLHVLTCVLSRWIPTKEQQFVKQFENLAVSAEKLGDYESAAFYLQKLVSLFPSEPQYAYNLARVLFLNGESAYALAVLEHSGTLAAGDLFDWGCVLLAARCKVSANHHCFS